jgi:signal transduction histidine kinase
VSAGRRPGGELLLVTRLFTAGIAVIALIYQLGTLTIVIEPHGLALPGWYQALTLTVLALAVVMGIVALRVPLAAVRRMNGAWTVLYLAATATLVPALLAHGDLHTGGRLPWALTASALPVVSATLVWGARGGWAVLGVVTVYVRLLRAVAGDTSRLTVVNDVQGCITSMILCVLVAALLDSAREMDAAGEAARSATDRRAAELARHSARMRTHALVHDEVLATFSFAGHAAVALRAPLAEQAGRARGLLADLARTVGEGYAVTVAELSARLRALVGELDAGAAFREPADAGAVLPAESAEALVAAAHQALANSVAHAGPGVLREVVLTVDGPRVSVVVRDDGCGFDPRRIPARRLGVTTSILGRMRTLPGGTAVVDSAPGRGTVVTLGWAPPDGRVGAPRVASVRAVWDQASADHRLVTVLFALSQLGLAASLAVSHPAPWTPMLAATGILLALSLLGWTDGSRPRPAVAALVCLAVMATTALVLVPTGSGTPGVLRYGDAWYVVGCGYVLALLAMRGRPRAALTGLAGVLLVLIAAVAARGYGTTELGAIIGRTVAVVGISAGLTWGTIRLRDHSARLRATELAARADAAWAETMRAELSRRSTELGERVGPLLRRLEEGTELTAAEIAECRALEGGLRDDFRGGRLARGPLIAAAAAARRRGVDVVLIDDVPDHSIAEPTLDAVATWMGERLHATPAGSFVGGLLPAGDDRVAIAVSGEESASFAG